MLALPEPYGWSKPDWAALRLTTDQPFDAAVLADILRSYSCYEPAIPRIVSCLHHGGHYECCVEGSWVNSPEDLYESLGEIGIKLTFRYFKKNGVLEEASQSLHENVY